MRKIPGLLLLLALLLLTSGFSLNEWRASMYQGIKQQAADQFSVLFGRRVTIESSGGVIVGQIELNGFTVPGIGRAAKVVLSFNPVKYALARGDMVQALTAISVVNGDFRILRDRTGKWEILNLMAGGPGGGGPPPFHGNIILKDCAVDYQDLRGWRATPEPFEARVRSLNGLIDLRQQDKINFTVSGKLPETVRASGTLDTKKLLYDLKISAEKLPLEKWANYTVPLSDFKASGGVADIGLRWAGSLTGRLVLHDGAGRFQSLNFSRANGTLFVVNEKLVVNDLRFELNQQPLIVNAQVTDFANPRLEGEVRLGKANVHTRLSLDRTKKEPLLVLAAKVSNLELGQLTQNAPGIKGRLYGDLDIAGPIDHLKGNFSARLAGASIFAQPFENTSASFSITNGDFLLEKFSATDGNVGFKARGKINHDLAFDFQAEAAGLHLRGQNLLGEISATLDKFLGEIHGKIDQVFLASPLRNLAASGEVSFSAGQIGEQKFDQARGNILIGGGKIEIADIFVQEKESSLEVSGQAGLGVPTILLVTGTGLKASLHLKIEPEGTLTGTAEGTIDLSGWEHLTTKYGKLRGQVGVSLALGGSMQQPSLSSSFWLDKFSVNDVYLDSITGSLSYANDKLAFPSPLIIRSGEDSYALAGNLQLNPDQPALGSMNLELKVDQAQLGTAYHLFNRLTAELARRSLAPAERKSIRLDLEKIGLPPFSNQALYHQDGKNNYLLKDWNAIRLESAKYLATVPEENIGGNFTADISLAGQFNAPSGRFIGYVNDGFFRNYPFDDLFISGSLDDKSLKIEEAVLSKGRGTLTVRGDYQFKNRLSLDFTAQNFPLDVLQIPFPSKSFKGAFDLEAQVKGPLEKIDGSIAASGKKVSLSSLDFDQFNLVASKEGPSIQLNELSLSQGGLRSNLAGSVLLSHPGEIDLTGVLRGNAVGLFNLFTDEIKWKEGAAYCSARLKGTLDNPQISGKLSVKNGTLYVRALDSNIYDLEGSAEVKGDLLEISRLRGNWRGKKTRDLTNALGLAGNIDLRNIFAEKGKVALDLALSPTRLYLDLPNLYTGVLTLSDITLQGPLSFDLSDGPTLRGKASINDAVITLAPAEPGGKALPLALDLEADLARNVYATMGDVSTLNLSNILMDLEIGGKLKVGGDLKFPRLNGKIMVKRGTVNIFNREFSLLSEDEQKKYFPYETEKIRANTADFSGEEGPAGLQPNLNISSSVVVEDQQSDASGKPVKKKVTILARLNGATGAKEETRALKISLLSFAEDPTKTPTETVPAGYSEQDLKVLLLPDFIKSLAGINQPGAQTTSVDTNAVVADYLSSRVQAVLFRSLERNAEQALGLESLTLEYNFGPQIREAIGVKEAAGFQEEKPAWSVGFVKGFFDRLFIDVRYSQAFEQTNYSNTAAQNSFNYQLTYKFNPIWSILYYREPVSINEPTTGYQKITLKAGFYLW